jgi:acetyl-CoA C-acetyltransferase
MSIDRQCASGLMAIATAAKQVIVDRMDIVVAGGQESISLVQTPRCGSGPDPELLSHAFGVYMPMLQTAETVAKRYGISRERAGRICAAVAAAHRRRAGRGPVRRRDRAGHRDDGGEGQGDRRDRFDARKSLDKDEGNRPETTLEGLARSSR